MIRVWRKRVVPVKAGRLPPVSGRHHRARTINQAETDGLFQGFVPILRRHCCTLPEVGEGFQGCPVRRLRWYRAEKGHSVEISANLTGFGNKAGEISPFLTGQT